MDNPCKYCDKANMDFVNDCEYGCDNPCQKAKDFYKQVGNNLDELFVKDVITHWMELPKPPRTPKERGEEK